MPERHGRTIRKDDLRVVDVRRLLHPLELFKCARRLEGDDDALARREAAIRAHRPVGVKCRGIARGIVRPHRIKGIGPQNLRANAVLSRRIRGGHTLENENRLVKARLLKKSLALHKKRLRLRL